MYSSRHQHCRIAVITPEPSGVASPSSSVQVCGLISWTRSQICLCIIAAWASRRTPLTYRLTLTSHASHSPQGKSAAVPHRIPAAAVLPRVNMPHTHSLTHSCRPSQGGGGKTSHPRTGGSQVVCLRLRVVRHSLRSPSHSAYGLCIRSARATLTTQLLESSTARAVGVAGYQ